ncbi:MAG TPA: hypothetical protein VN541_08165 [Tepidisphaeraceae bacterium]|nr:hypothetical protein [Tepidisphaeraceae bacterium]
MTRSTLAVAADYAEAMLIARRWKNWMVLLLLLFLVIQIGIFLVVRYAGGPSPATTQPVLTAIHDWSGLEWLINVTDFLGIICVVVLAVLLLLITAIMLVGRLIGVSFVTGAFVWCVVLGALLFPWQSLWNYPVAGTMQTAPTPEENIQVGPSFGLPGVLYTWPELQHRAHFGQHHLDSDGDRWTAIALAWARFVGWPAVAIILLFVIHLRSGRGLKLALGEAEVQGTDAGEAIPPPAV